MRGNAKREPGDVVFTSSGGYLKLSSGTWLADKATVYNITVDDYHTYFVGEAGVWVHNNKFCSHASKKVDTVLYQKVDKDGKHLKYGIAKIPQKTRYTKKQMDGGRLKVLAQGEKKDMLKLERDLHETLPIGPEEGQKFYIKKQIEKGLKPPPYGE